MEDSPERPSCMEVYSVSMRTNVKTNAVSVVAHPNTCQRYQCMKCFNVRYNKSMARLRSIGLVYKNSDGSKNVVPLKIKRAIHATVGIVVPIFEEIAPTKKYIEKVMTKFHQRIRKLCQFRGCRVFDISKHKDGGWFVHFHYAILPEKGKQLSTDIMNALISDISGGRIQVFKIIGMRYLDKHFVKTKKGKGIWKKGLFDYFAKRMSGYFGHKEMGNNFYLEEVMSWEQADEIFLHMRKLVVVSPSEARLGSNIGNISPWKESNPDIKTEFLGITFKLKSDKPPPKQWNSLWEAMKYILKQNYASVNFEGDELIQQYLGADFSQFSRNHEVSTIGYQRYVDGSI